MEADRGAAEEGDGRVVLVIPYLLLSGASPPQCDAPFAPLCSVPRVIDYISCHYGGRLAERRRALPLLFQHVWAKRGEARAHAAFPSERQSPPAVAGSLFDNMHQFNFELAKNISHIGNVYFISFS